MTVENKKSAMGYIQWIALAILVAAMFSASKRAAVPAIMALVKFCWPLVLAWVVWKFMKTKISGVVGKFQEQVMQQAAAAQGQARPVGGDAGVGAQFRSSSKSAGKTRSPAGGDVLDLCPKCGVLLTPNHRCG